MISNLEAHTVVFQRTSPARAASWHWAAPVKTAGNLATFLDVPMLALHTMHSGPPELADQLPTLARLAISMDNTGEFRYWYANLEVPWRMSLPEDVDPAHVPQGWLQRDGARLIYLARELVVAFPADSPPMTVDQPNIGVGIAVVTDPSLVQDLAMNPAKVAYVGGFSGDLTAAVTPLAARTTRQ
ncbi:hypothetical protein [Mycobacteroides abscessus]|uniref:hypothetical protein n=1 Tax=Mycobacteroides abscessus TaxID=36809 RepID=UPI001C654F51